METSRPWLALWIMGAIGAWASGATAAGFGNGASGAVLGQPLDFAVPLRLDAGETLEPGCLSAEVTVGDRRLAPGAVQTSFTMTGPETARVHVRTVMTVDEPVVGVQVHAGCNVRISRRFVLLADPPLAPPSSTVAATAPAFAATPADAATAPVPSPSLPQATTRGAASDAGAEAAPARPGRADARQASAQRSARAANRRTAGDRRGPPGAIARADAAARRTAGRRNAPATDARSAQAAPRLRLEAAEPLAAARTAAAVSPSEEAIAVEQALLVVAQAASAARQAAAAASASQARIRELERTVETLRGEARGQRDLALQLRDRLARSEAGNRWWWPMLLALLALAGVSLWLARRLQQVQRQQQARWRSAAAGDASAAADAASGAADASAPSTTATTVAAPPPPAASRAAQAFVTAEPRVPAPAAVARAGGSPAWPPPAPPEQWNDSDLLATQPLPQRAAPAAVPAPEPAMQRTDVLPPRPTPPEAADAGASRDVSIEELIDLEQQAEFFVVLGQDDAAIELLAEHLRSTGGGSPLPYLKLLEIYRRRGDRDDYERTRGRFNQRFNAYAPEWGSDLAAGRSLEDYPGIVPRLQQAWPRPLDAMAEMEAMLFRKSRGDLFDLPAYRELLFLYALARDHLDREGTDAGSVDLLLPLSAAAAPGAADGTAGGADFGSTRPLPHHLAFDPVTAPARDPDHGGLHGHAGEDRPTAPLDFDLSADPDQPSSIFDPMAASPRKPLRR
jgi:hypothetical protein